MHCRLVIAHVQSFPCVEWTNVFTCTSLSRAQLHPLSTAPKTSSGADLVGGGGGGGGGGAPGARPPPFRSSNYIFMLRNRTV